MGRYAVLLQMTAPMSMLLKVVPLRPRMDMFAVNSAQQLSAPPVMQWWEALGGEALMAIRQSTHNGVGMFGMIG